MNIDLQSSDQSGDFAWRTINFSTALSARPAPTEESLLEIEVLEKVVTGKLNKVIASDLGLSTRTVEIHRSRVMEKMEADSLAHLVRMHVAVEKADG